MLTMQHHRGILFPLSEAACCSNRFCTAISQAGRTYHRLGHCHGRSFPCCPAAAVVARPCWVPGEPQVSQRHHGSASAWVKRTKALKSLLCLRSYLQLLQSINLSQLLCCQWQCCIVEFYHPQIPAKSVTVGGLNVTPTKP